MTISLTQIPKQDLIALAKGEAPLGVRALPGSLPPPFVATRALQQLHAGKSAMWCSTFYVRNEAGDVVGGCGFKDAPENGEVEIGYAVSSVCRSRGIATSAVRMLVELAEQSAEVSTVVAAINPRNLPSIRVVQKLGFAAAESFTDADGEDLVKWRRGTTDNTTRD